MGQQFTVRKSDGVKVYHDKKSDGVRLDHEKKSNGVREFTMRKRTMG